MTRLSASSSARWCREKSVVTEAVKLRVALMPSPELLAARANALDAAEGYSSVVCTSATVE